MELDLENSVENTNEESRDFLQELESSLKIKKEEKKTYLDEVFENGKVLDKYREQMYEERSNILREYSKETEDKGCMYYIYSINSNEPDLYNVAVYDLNKNGKILMYSENLPEGANIRECI